MKSEPPAPRTKLSVYTDGGARGNPGPSGIGVFITDGDNTVAEISRYIGHATNNEAEYIAVIYGLQEAIYLKATHVVLYTDSQLVAKQLSGDYKIKDKGLRKLYDIAANQFRGFEKVDIRHIPREDNSEADRLVNRALDLETLL